MFFFERPCFSSGFDPLVLILGQSVINSSETAGKFFSNFIPLCDIVVHERNRIIILFIFAAVTSIYIISISTAIYVNSLNL